MEKRGAKSFHTGTVKKSIVIKASKQKVWRKVSNVIGLPSWLVDVKKPFSCPKKGMVLGQFEKLPSMMEIP